MNVSLVSNVLDLVAFLLVTIDLYGRERLEAASARLRSIKLAGNTLAAMGTYVTQRPVLLSFLSFVGRRIILSFCMSIATVAIVLVFFGPSNTIMVCFHIFIYVMPSVFILSIIRAVFGLGLLILWFTLQGTMEFLIGASKKVGAEGTLLCLGTLLFLFSRAISIRAALQ